MAINLLSEECVEVIKKLLHKHKFLQPNNPNFDHWDARDAKELTADLIELLQYSEMIEDQFGYED
jgi:hypothetical protein